MVILEENFKWHLEAFASELFNFNSLIMPFNAPYNAMNDGNHS